MIKDQLNFRFSYEFALVKIHQKTVCPAPSLLVQFLQFPRGSGAGQTTGSSYLYCTVWPDSDQF